jgi:hypothetical protein
MLAYYDHHHACGQSQRPLTASQVHYAALDAVVLTQLVAKAGVLRP